MMNSLIPEQPARTDQIGKPSLIVRCPDCGSQKIGEVERALVTMEVMSFTRNADGELCAAEYTGDPLPDWQTADKVDFPFQCMECELELTEEDLLIDEMLATSGGAS